MSEEGDVKLPIAVTIHDVDELAVHRLQSAIQTCVGADQKFLPVTIMSPGGDVHALFAMIDLMQHGPVPCATIAVGIAASAGAVLLASGHKGLRFVSPNTSVLVHEMSARTPQQPITEMEADVGVFRDMNTRMLAHLDKSCGKRSGYWLNRLRKIGHRDLTLSATEAVSAGLADHIGLPVVQVEEQVAVTLTMPQTAAKRKAKK